MGANEKHAATYHGLSDDTVRGRYCDGTHAQTGHTTDGAEYDTWLAGVKAEAKAEALNEAAHALDSATINIEMLNGDPDLKQAWAFRGSERKSIIRSLRIRADRHKEN